MASLGCVPSLEALVEAYITVREEAPAAPSLTLH